MKIFFTASQRGKKDFSKQYESIYKSLEELKYTVIDDDLINISTSQFYNKLEAGGRAANIEFYKRKINNIKEADLVILECSFHSLSIGFVVEKSLEFNKPTIVLYLKNNEPYFLEGVESDKLIMRSYTPKNVKSVLKETLELAREKRDKRFNFFISPKLLNYLEHESKKLGITKSTFIRNLIIDNKKKQES